MITLYAKDATDFTSNGLGVLDGGISAVPEVEEFFNGAYTLTLRYVSWGRYYDLIDYDCIIKAPTPDGDQRFRVAKLTKQIGYVEVVANHIFYDLAGNFIEDANLVDQTGGQALAHIGSSLQSPTSFTFKSNIDTTASARLVRLNAVQALLDSSQDNSFVSRWGGELLRDNDQVIFNAVRGSNRGFSVKYGKNLTSYEATIDTTSVVTRIMPYGFDGLMIPEKYVDSDLIDKYPFVHTKKIEYSEIKAIDPDSETNDETAVPLEDAYDLLRAAAQNEYTTNHVDQPAANFKVSFQDLQKTREYADFEALETLLPWDYVSVDADGLPINARMISYRYDPLNQRYIEVELGNYIAQYTDTVAGQVENLTATVSGMSQNVTKAITAANGKNTNYYGTAEPANPHDGDLWFKQNGDAVEMWQWDAKSVPPEWKMLVTDLTGTEISETVDKSLEKLSNDLLASQANLAVATQDIANLQVKLQQNDATQAQLTKDLAANAQLVTANKQSVDATLATVNKTLTQAQTDTATAVQKADDAVTNAQSAVDASGLATKTANAANDAAIAAKTLATSTAADFATVQSQAKSAASDASTALSNANNAMGQASTAIGNASDALTQAKSALATASSVQTSMQPAIMAAVDTVKGELTASIQTVKNGLDNIQIGGRNYLLDSDISRSGTGSSWGSLGAAGTSNLDLFNSLRGKTITISVDIEWSNWKTGYYNNRLGVEWHLYFSDGTDTYIGAWETPNQESKPNHRYSFTTSVPDKEIASIDQSSFFVQANCTATIGHAKIETGTKATDWSPAPEDVQGQITTNSVNITANSKEIALAAKQSVVDTLTQQVQTNTTQLKLTATEAELTAQRQVVDNLNKTVTSNSTAIKANADAFLLKAEQSVVDTINNQVTTNTAQLKLTATSAELQQTTQSVDALTGRVDTAEGIIKATSDALTQVYTKSETTNLLTPYATQTWTQGQVIAAANQWSVDLASVQTKIDNLQVGGTNLLPDALTMASWKIDAAGNGEIADAGSELGVSGAMMLHMYGEAWASFSPDYTKVCLTKGEKYTYSAYVKSESAGSASLEAYYSSGDTQLGAQPVIVKMESLTPNWQRFGYTFTSTVDGPVTIRFECGDYGPIGSMFVALEKLERGTVMTDWSPAPADAAVYTDTAVASLKLTVDGLSGTFAKQSDLALATTNLKVTSDGLNLLTAVTGVKGEKITQVIADVNTLETQMTGPDGATARIQTLEGFQQTATGNISNLQSQQTTLAGQWTSTVARLDNLSIGGTNLLPDSLTMASWKVDGPNSGDIVEPDVALPIQGAMMQHLYTTGWGSFSPDYSTVNLTKGETYTYSGYFRLINDGTARIQAFYSAGDTQLGAQLAGDKQIELGITWKRVSFTFISTVDGPVTIRFETPDYDSISGSLFIALEKLEIGTVATDWSPSPYDLATGTQITQLQNQIDLRSTVAGKVTAALSLSSDGGGTVTIQGASLYVTAASHFDDASIQSAAIANLDATKITTGTLSADRLATTELNADNIISGSIAAARIASTALSATNITSGTLDVGKLTVKNLSADLIASGTIDASKITVKNLSASNIIGGTLDASTMTVKNIDAAAITTGTLNAASLNVVGLNASAITTGTISGANLAINLNTGEVMFQKGSIKSADGHLNIDVNDGTFTQSDGTKGMMFAKGNLYLSSSSWWDGLSNPDAAPKPDYGFIGYGDTVVQVRGFEVVGRDSLTLGLTDKGNPGMEYTASPVITMDRSNVVLDFAGELATIQAGKEFTIQTNPIYNLGQTPGIQIGSNVDRSGIGDRVFIDGSFVHIPSAYSRTASGSANVIVAADGALVRTSSATKYKSNIERFRNADMGEALLNLPQAHWYNKQDMQRYADDPQHYSMPELDYGMIAEDLAAAGLEDLVVRGDDGQLEDIRYDRIAPALLPLLAKMKQEIEELKSAAKSA